MRAIQTVAMGQVAIVDVSEPEVKPDSILIRPLFVGNNSCNEPRLSLHPEPNPQVRLLCCGLKYRSRGEDDPQPGDKVCGTVAGDVGCDVTRGAFAELVPAYGDFVFPLPNKIIEARWICPV